MATQVEGGFQDDTPQPVVQHITSDPSENFANLFTVAMQKHNVPAELMHRMATQLMTELGIAQLVKEHSDLVEHLHLTQQHPQFEYCATALPVGTGSVQPPEGHGWIPNDAIESPAVVDKSEVTYWRRSKHDALRDPVDPFQLPSIQLERLNTHRFWALVLSRFAANRAAFTVFHSTPQQIIHLAHGTGEYTLDRGLPNLIDVEAGADPKKLTNGTFTLKPGVHYFGVALAKIEIISELKESDDGTISMPSPTYVRTLRRDGAWGDWMTWDRGRMIAINPMDVNEALEQHA